MNQNSPLRSVCAAESAPEAAGSVQKERKQVDVARHRTPKNEGNAVVDITIIMGPDHVATLMIGLYCTIQPAKAADNDSPFELLVCHVPTESTSGIVGRGGTTCVACCIGGWLPHWTWATDTASSRGVCGVVVAKSSRLHDLHWQINFQLDVLAGNDRANNQAQEDDEKEKVQDGITDDTALTKLGLLERVDRGTDLTTIVC